MSANAARSAMVMLALFVEVEEKVPDKSPLNASPLPGLTVFCTGCLGTYGGWGVREVCDPFVYEGVVDREFEFDVGPAAASIENTSFAGLLADSVGPDAYAPSLRGASAGFEEVGADELQRSANESDMIAVERDRPAIEGSVCRLQARRRDI